MTTTPPDPRDEAAVIYAALRKTHGATGRAFREAKATEVAKLREHPPLVTRGDRHLEDLKRWYAEGKISWEGFVSGVDLNLHEQAKGWAQDLVRSSEAQPPH